MKIAFLIIIGFLLFGCTKEERKNSLTKAKIHGRVKCITTHEYGALEKFGKIQKSGLKWSSISKYDHKGNEVEANSYSSDGSISARHIYKYDDNGNRIAWDTYNSDWFILYKRKSRYDDKGNLLEDTDANNYRYTYKYDDNQNMIEGSIYDPDGSLSGRSIYKYDDNGNKEVNGYSSDGSLHERSNYQYDNHGNLINQAIYSSNGSLRIRSTYRYDEHGNLVEEENNFGGKRSYKYDDFDENGNWRIKTYFINENPDMIEEREIEYY